MTGGVASLLISPGEWAQWGEGEDVRHGDRKEPMMNRLGSFWQKRLG